jgi:adenylosuccinate lyase
MINVLSNLYVNKERMQKNVELSQGRIMSESIMIALTKKGMNRQEAHELLRKLAMRSLMKKQPFKRILLETEAISERLTEKEIDKALNPMNYLGTALDQVDLVVKKTKEERETRELA